MKPARFHGGDDPEIGFLEDGMEPGPAVGPAIASSRARVQRFS